MDNKSELRQDTIDQIKCTSDLLIYRAIEYVRALAVLPIDPEVDDRIERLMAFQPKVSMRKPLQTK